MRTSSFVAVLVMAALGSAEGHWLNHRDPSIPRTPDGRPDLSAPAPRLNGRPDLSGLWEAERTPVSEFVRVMGPGLPEIQRDASLPNLVWQKEGAIYAGIDPDIYAHSQESVQRNIFRVPIP